MPSGVTSGKLKAALAKAANLPPKMVDYPWRRARDHDLVSYGKTGKGGASMTLLDAVKAPIIVGSGFMPGELVEVFRSLCDQPAVETASRHLGSDRGWAIPNERSERGQWIFDGLDLPHLQNLPPHHSFLAALEAVFKTSLDCGFSSAIKQAFPDTQPGHSVSVNLAGPDLKADISITLSAIDESGSRLWYEEEAGYFPPDRREGDLEVSVRIGHKTIHALTNLFREESE